ncbi:MAG: hypothetical protein CMM07_02365 [Rhodopirellula sp.]|nr:hypothetical protein [Rhodopirellula sp.]
MDSKHFASWGNGVLLRLQKPQLQPAETEKPAPSTYKSGIANGRRAIIVKIILREGSARRPPDSPQTRSSKLS